MSNQRNQIFNLSLNKKTVIGRSEECDITINKEIISREHAYIYHENESFWVIDNDSSSGTKVNGLPIEAKRELNFNDVVRVGDYTFTLVCEFSNKKGGKFYYLEIRKIKKQTGAAKSPVPTAVLKVSDTAKLEGIEKENVANYARSSAPKASDTAKLEDIEKERAETNVHLAEAEIDTEKLIELALQSNDDLGNVFELSAEAAASFNADESLELIDLEKLKVEKTSKKRNKKKKVLSNKKTSKNKKKQLAYLKKLGSGVADRLRLVKIDRNAVFGRIKQMTYVSIVFHIVLVYFMGKYILGSAGKEEVREITVTLKEQEELLETPEVPVVEQVEPEVQEAEISSANLQVSVDAQATSVSDAISENTNESATGEVSVVPLGGGLGDINVGNGKMGVRDGSFMKRILGSKGRYGNVDIRISLIWDGHSDLDLHVHTPSGRKLFHGAKTVGGGVLDLDQNLTETVSNPVENVIWKKADDGEYRAFLVFYKRRSKGPIKFKVEMEIFGNIYHYKGVVDDKHLRIDNGDNVDVDIVTFEVRDGKHMIGTSINDKPVKEVKDPGLDLVVP